MITENKFHSIIRKELNRVITEGHSSEIERPRIEYYADYFIHYFTECMDGYHNDRYNPNERRFTIFVYYDYSLKRFNIDYDKSVCIIVHYYPFKEGKPFAVNGGSHLGTPNGDIIELYIFNNASREDIVIGIEHELTHIIDTAIGNDKELALPHRHQVTGSDCPLPHYISRLLYRLWDVREFNAWQANYFISPLKDLSGFVDQMMGWLEQANDDNSEETWAMLKNYLTHNKTMDTAKFEKMNLKKLKKYFINTSFRQLKKFIKKIKDVR